MKQTLKQLHNNDLWVTSATHGVTASSGMTFKFTGKIPICLNLDEISAMLITSFHAFLISS